MPKVLVVPVNKAPEVKDIPSGLEPMQELVGGFIENVTLEEGVGLICNEEGMLRGLLMNRVVPEAGGVVVGPFFISRYNEEGETVDLTEQDITKYTKRFALAQ